MTLKRQLAVASLLMLLIPWAGLQFVLELDDALRQQALQQVQDQARRLAIFAGDELIGQAPVTADTPAIYAEPIDRALNLDGYANDWPGYEEGESLKNWQTPAHSQPAASPRLRWQAVINHRDLYLLIQVSDRTPVLFNPGMENQPYDHLVLFLQPPASGVETAPRQQSWLIRTSAPGELSGLSTGNSQKPDAWTPDYRVTGSWQSAGTGWQLELKMPAPPAGSRLGFSAHWPEQGGGQNGEQNREHSVGTSVTPLPVLVRRDRPLERQLEPRLNSGQRIRVLEPGGWVTARQQVGSKETSPEFDSLSPLQVIEQISLNALRSLVQLYQPKPALVSTMGYQASINELPEEGLVKHEDGSVWLMTTEPVFGGRSLVLEQSLDQLLTLSGTTLGSVIARSTLIIIGLTLVLLGYASWLSWRITRLQKAVNASIDEDGRITGTLPESRARDELGQLQRHFSQMVNRLHGYNNYLESFSRRLSHELKTPVAIVRSSLENLNHSESDTERQQYIERAATATSRLSQILNGMSEAARLEQSFDHADKERFDLAEVAAQATGTYQTLTHRNQIRYTGPENGCPMTGSPELMVQLLDKLVDNARDFTPLGGLIEVRLEPTAAGSILSVFNQGSSLPENTADIFGPFVSLRDDSAKGHLGQGLLIVRLIADFHDARVEAGNTTSGNIRGVCFRVFIPATGA